MLHGREKKRGKERGERRLGSGLEAVLVSVAAAPAAAAEAVVVVLVAVVVLVLVVVVLVRLRPIAPNCFADLQHVAMSLQPSVAFSLLRLNGKRREGDIDRWESKHLEGTECMMAVAEGMVVVAMGEDVVVVVVVVYRGQRMQAVWIRAPSLSLRNFNTFVACWWMILERTL